MRSVEVLLAALAGLAGGTALARGAEAAAVPEGDAGIAAKYPGDAGIAGDPAALFVEDFEAADLKAVCARWTETKNPKGDDQFKPRPGVPCNADGGSVWFDNVVLARSYIGPAVAAKK